VLARVVGDVAGFRLLVMVVVGFFSFWVCFVFLGGFGFCWICLRTQ